MTQVYHDFSNKALSLSFDNMLALVNEQLVKPTDRKPTSQLEAYFRGYKEFAERPPSPALSDQDHVSAYSEQDDQRSMNLGETPPTSPPRRPQLQHHRQEVYQQKISHGRETHKKQPHEPGKPRCANKLKPRLKTGLKCGASGWGTQWKGGHLEAGRVVKAYSRSTHHMETRSRTRIGLKNLKATQRLESNADNGFSGRRQRPRVHD